MELAGAALLIALTISLLRDTGNRFVPWCALGGGVLLTLWGIRRLGGVFSSFLSLADETALSPYLTLILKALGVGYVVEVAAELCRDVGAEQTARRLELCGRAELLLLAIPPLTELIKLACEMAEGV